MKLQTKVLLVLAAIVVLSVVLNFGVLQSLVMPSFEALEEHEAEQNLKRFREAIDTELNGLARSNADWKNWDDTYQYAADRNKSYEEDNFGDFQTTISNLGVNAIYIYDIENKRVLGQAMDLDTGKILSGDGFYLDTLRPEDPLLQHPTIVSAKTGIVLTSQGPMLVASGPILNTNLEGPSHGTFIMGRFLTEAVIAELSNRTRVELGTWVLDGHELAAGEREALAQLGAEQESFLVEKDEQTLSAYGLLRDVYGEPAILVRTDTPKRASAMGARTLKFALLGILITGLIALAVIVLLLNTIVVGPVLKLAGHVTRVGKSNDMSARIGNLGRDEIGQLAANFNDMLERLQDAQRRLTEQSFQLGLTEMAAGVLHNVRNQLNPLSLKIGRLQEAMEPIPREKLNRVVTELTRSDIPEDQREELSEYLRLSVDDLADRQDKVRAQLENMTRQIESFDTMLAEQDAISEANHVIEAVDVRALIDEALSFVEVPENVHVSLADLGSDREPLSAMAQGFLLKQILVNIIVNAKEAIVAADRVRGDIEIACAQEVVDEAEFVHVKIKDNGCGIEKQSIADVFRRGYSTKQGKRRGLGLHWCANTAVAMNGKVRAESAGLDQGAVFHIYLPVVRELASAA